MSCGPTRVSNELIVPGWPAPPNIVAGTTLRDTDLSALPAQPIFLHQVHEAAVVSIGDVRRARDPLDADAVTGSQAGDLVAVRTADCLPLLLCAKDGSEIAAVHGGWRGVVAGVIENAVAALRSAPDELLAWLGPAISQAAFEVGAEVRDAFLAQDATAQACFAPNERGRWQADLYGLARMRLVKTGVNSVYGGEFCTFADQERFYSYRRNPDCGRMVSFVYLGG